MFRINYIMVKNMVNSRILCSFLITNPTKKNNIIYFKCVVWWFLLNKMDLLKVLLLVYLLSWGVDGCFLYFFVEFSIYYFYICLPGKNI